jgi:hypothetical protein
MLLYKMYEIKSSLRDNSHVFEDMTYVIDSVGIPIMQFFIKINFF